MGNSKKIQKNEVLNVETPNAETPTIEIQTIETQDVENQTIETPIEGQEIKKRVIRSYNHPEFKSEDIKDLNAVQFPIKFEDEKGNIHEFSNRFGDLKEGDYITFKINGNNRNTFPVGKIIHFRIQSNGFWIRFEAFDKTKNWKNLNLFVSKSTEEEIQLFNEKRKEHFSTQTPTETPTEN